MSIKIHVVKPFSFQIMSTESVGSRRELVANSVDTADADATQLDSCVASAVCIVGLGFVGKTGFEYRPRSYSNIRIIFVYLQGFI